MAQQSGSLALGPALLGREFVNPLFDYLLIGGGLSLLVAGFILINPIEDIMVSKISGIQIETAIGIFSLFPNTPRK